jgi:hypothetical protein
MDVDTDVAMAKLPSLPMSIVSLTQQHIQQEEEETDVTLTPTSLTTKCYASSALLGNLT